MPLDPTYTSPFADETPADLEFEALKQRSGPDEADEFPEDAFEYNIYQNTSGGREKKWEMLARYHADKGLPPEEAKKLAYRQVALAEKEGRLTPSQTLAIQDERKAKADQEGGGILRVDPGHPSVNTSPLSTAAPSLGSASVPQAPASKTQLTALPLDAVSGAGAVMQTPVSQIENAPGGVQPRPGQAQFGSPEAIAGDVQGGFNKKTVGAVTEANAQLEEAGYSQQARNAAYNERLAFNWRREDQLKIDREALKIAQEKVTQAQEAMQAHRTQPTEFSTLGKVMFVLSGAIEGALNQGRATQTIGVIRDLIQRDQEFQRGQFKEKKAQAEGAQTAAEKLYTIIGNRRAAEEYDYAQKLEPIMSRLQLQLEGVKDQHIAANLQTLLGELQLEHGNAMANFQAMVGQQSLVEAQIRNLDARTAGVFLKGAGGPGKGGKSKLQGNVFKVSENTFSSIPGIQFYDEKGNKIDHMTVDEKALRENLDMELRMVKKYADVVRTVQYYNGAGANLVNDEIKKSLGSLMAQVMTQIISSGPRISDLDLSWYEKSFAELKPGAFWTILSEKERLNTMVNSLAGYNRGLVTALQLRGQRAYPRVDGVVIPMSFEHTQSKGKAVPPGAIKNQLGSLAMEYTPDGISPFMEAFKVYAGYEAEKKNVPQLRAAQIAASKRFAKLRKENPELYAGLVDEYMHYSEQLSARIREATGTTTTDRVGK